MRCRGVPKHGPNDECTCEGCWACVGSVVGCTCDIDWSCVYGDHTATCGGEEE